MITYALKVTEMTCLPQAEGQTDVVILVGWAYTGTQNGVSAAFGGTTQVTYVSGSPFTPYDQLTEAQVSEWVLNTWTPEELKARQDAIASQVATVSPPLPWSATSSPDEL